LYGGSHDADVQRQREIGEVAAARDSHVESVPSCAKERMTRCCSANRSSARRVVMRGADDCDYREHLAHDWLNHEGHEGHEGRRTESIRFVSFDPFVLFFR
jgi:hypothetical protein